MFVFNLKVNSSLVLKIFLSILLAIVLGIVGLSIYRLMSSSPDACTDSSEVYTLTTDNYTNILKAVHENIDTYIGQKIAFSGYIYRVYDFSDTQFVLARDMVISSDSQTLVVGFLCHYDKASSFNNGCWVNITGTISKGYYHGDIPIIEIEHIEEIEKPDNVLVYPPDETFVQTSTVL